MTNDNTTKRNNHRGSYTPSIVAELRRLMPDRPLRFAEACRIAELQANRLLKLTESTSAPLSEAAITEQPRIEVQRVGSLIGSGATAWSRGLWRIRINGAEPITRQRFTLAHEFKHILDAASEDVIYRHLPHGSARDRHIEAVCDHFAACLLMPKAWVKKAWGEGTQDLGQLSWKFEVSQQAMLIRLQYLGLVDPLPRHAVSYRLGRMAVDGARLRPHSRGHRRSLHRIYRRTSAFRPRPVVLQGVPT